MMFHVFLAQSTMVFLSQTYIPSNKIIMHVSFPPKHNFSITIIICTFLTLKIVPRSRNLQLGTLTHEIVDS